MIDRGTVPKHVEFYSKNKFEKLVHLVGFIIRIVYSYSIFLACSGRCCVSADVMCTYFGTCEHIIHHVMMFDVSKAVLLKTQIFWHVPCSRMVSTCITIFKTGMDWACGTYG